MSIFGEQTVLVKVTDTMVCRNKRKRERERLQSPNVNDCFSEESEWTKVGWLCSRRLQYELSNWSRLWTIIISSPVRHNATTDLLSASLKPLKACGWAREQGSSNERLLDCYPNEMKCTAFISIHPSNVSLRRQWSYCQQYALWYLWSCHVWDGPGKWVCVAVRSEWVKPHASTLLTRWSKNGEKESTNTPTDCKRVALSVNLHMYSFHHWLVPIEQRMLICAR